MNLGVRLRPSEFGAVCEALSCVDTPDSVDYVLLFQYLGGGLIPESRLDTLKRAYRRLRRSASGDFVVVDTLLEIWSPRCYPGVASGDVEAKDAYRDFASQWEVLHHDGHVSPEDFLEYYRDVSIFYEDSADFIEMLRVAWDL